MVKITKYVTVFTMGLLFLSLSVSPASAKRIKIDISGNARQTEADAPVATDSVAVPAPADEGPGVIFPGKSHSLAFSHFTWGAEAGSSLDLTTNDLSTFDVDVVLGFKNSFIKLAGIGAGIHRSIHTGNNFIPVYAVLRTSFRRKPSLFFLNLQAGYSFNSISDAGTLGDFTGALGVGINLQQSSVAKSYIILSGAYQYFSTANLQKIDLDQHYIFFARLVIGVNF